MQTYVSDWSDLPDVIEEGTPWRVKKLRKKCTACGYDKPLSKFQKHPTTSDGFTNHCRQCRTQRQAEQRRRKRMEKIRQSTFGKW